MTVTGTNLRAYNCSFPISLCFKRIRPLSYCRSVLGMVVIIKACCGFRHDIVIDAQGVSGKYLNIVGWRRLVCVGAETPVEKRNAFKNLFRSSLLLLSYYALTF